MDFCKKTELMERRTRFQEAMNEALPRWDTALILDNVNQYYFTGTMQDGMLLLKRDGNDAYYVRKSYARALDESPLEYIYPMTSYRDAAANEGNRALGNVYIEADIAPYGVISRIGKHFQMKSVGSLEMVVRMVRARKSAYELDCLKRAGAAHNELFTNIVPTLLREGMTEAEFVGEFFAQMMRLGHSGINRFYKFGVEISSGQFSFGTHSLYPTSFDGPGGTMGFGPATPIAGSPNRRLERGDLIFIDTGFNIEGYHSDKTQVYLFGAEPGGEAREIHAACMEVELQVAAKLLPGAIPNDIYHETIDSLPAILQDGFMGYGSHTVKFLGHGVGLHIDELPVIANGFHTPIEAGMVFAVEPKKGLKGVGMLGVEDTYIVGENGPLCITGGGREMIVVDA